jgi:hypothetical protein
VLDDPHQRASRQAVVVPPLVHDQRMQLHVESLRACDAVRVLGCPNRCRQLSVSASDQATGCRT